MIGHIVCYWLLHSLCIPHLMFTLIISPCSLLTWTYFLSSEGAHVNTLTWCQFLLCSSQDVFRSYELWVTAAWFRFKLGPASGDSLSRVFILSQFKTGDKRKIMNNLNLPRKVKINNSLTRQIVPCSIYLTSILKLSFCCSRLSWHF